MTREGLYKALSPEGNPGFATIVRIAGALGYQLSFRPMDGINDNHLAEGGVEQA